MAFALTPRQQDAQAILSGDATHLMLFGGSRSGKTFLLTRNVVMRALKAPNSRHAIFRFRYNHLKASVVLDTFPKVMRAAFCQAVRKSGSLAWTTRTALRRSSDRSSPRCTSTSAARSRSRALTRR
jgi:hypothetical protein